MMLRSLLISGLIACVGGFAAGVAEAADMAPLFGQTEEPDITPPQQYTFGTGWYLRGDIGYGETPQLQIGANFPDIAGKHNLDGDIGAGYKINQWFRTDLTFDIHQGQHINTTGAQVICPYQLNGLYQNGNPQNTLGYAWSTQTGTCTGNSRGFEDQAEVMANGYVDVGTWYGITPYIGAGVGVSRINSSTDINYYKTSDGTPYGADLTPLGSYPLIWVSPFTGNALTPQPTIPGTNTAVPFAKQNWKQSVHQKQYNFAWALMGGFAYAIDNNLSLDIGYRYLNAGPYKTVPSPNNVSGVTKALTTQEVRLGLRYQID